MGLADSQKLNKRTQLFHGVTRSFEPNFGSLSSQSHPLAHLGPLQHLGYHRRFFGGVEGAHAYAHRKRHDAVLDEDVGIGAASGGFQAGLQADLSQSSGNHLNRGMAGVNVVSLIGIGDVQPDNSQRAVERVF